jgi:thiol-disulfide isomerase/thioredoxin
LSRFGDTATFKYIGYNSKPEGFAEGYYVPKVNAKTVDGNRFEFANYKDKYILLDFWGTWCVPCLKALPEIKKLNERFSDKDFVLVSVANDKDLEQVRRSISNNDMKWINVFQNEIAGGNQVDLIKKFKVSAYPTLILIDKDGKIISRAKSIATLPGC